MGVYLLFLVSLLVFSPSPPKDLHNCVGNVNDRIVSGLQTYTHLKVVIIVYSITLPRGSGEVLCRIGGSVIQTFMI